MRRHANRIIAVLAVLLILGAQMGSAYAYFTAYTKAEGGYPIHLGGKGEIEEKFASWTKMLTITADSDCEPVFVRAKGICARFNLTYDLKDGWTAGDDGYVYYDKPISFGGSTNELRIHIDNVPEEEVEEGDAFNVAVIYEMTPVLYEEDGTEYADWTRILEVVPEE